MHHRLFIAHHPICCAVAYLSRIGLFVMPWPVYDVSAYFIAHRSMAGAFCAKGLATLRRYNSTPTACMPLGCCFFNPFIGQSVLLCLLSDKLFCLAFYPISCFAVCRHYSSNARYFFASQFATRAISSISVLPLACKASTSVSHAICPLCRMMARSINCSISST